MSKMSPYIIALIAEGMSYDISEAGPKKYITKSLKNKILDVLVHHPGEFDSSEIAMMLGDVSQVAVRKVIRDLLDDPENAHLWKTDDSSNIKGPGQSDIDFLSGEKEVSDKPAKPERWRWPQGPPPTEPDPERERAYGPMPELYGQDSGDVEFDDSMWDTIDPYDTEEPEPVAPTTPSFRPRRGDSQARFTSFADRVRGRSPRSESFRRSLKRMMTESYDW